MSTMCKSCKESVAVYPNGLCIRCYDTVSHNGSKLYLNGYKQSPKKR